MDRIDSLLEEIGQNDSSRPRDRQESQHSADIIHGSRTIPVQDFINLTSSNSNLADLLSGPNAHGRSNTPLGNSADGAASGSKAPPPGSQSTPPGY